MPAQTTLRMIVLGSGSSGNAIALTCEDTCVLIDCGFSAREVTARLAAEGIAARDVAAVFVTHEHVDHTRGLDVFVRRDASAATVYATDGTARAAGLTGRIERLELIAPDEQARVGPLEVRAFRTCHDAADPVGLRIDAGACSAGVVTDTGFLPGPAIEALEGCALLGIEANHDEQMLARGPYPPHLKRRIHSERGHLSNAACAAGLQRLAHDGLREVIALHRSRTNNTAELAGTAIAERLRTLGLETKVTVASQHRSCRAEWTG